MAYNAKILADSLNPKGIRLTTFEVTYPRLVHSELMTHRVFSRNSASSRAIPIQKMIENIRKDPFTPVWWGKNQKGMQVQEEHTGFRKELIKFIWLKARYIVIFIAWLLYKLDLHKQIANRILEPWMWITVIISGTEWENFYFLRVSKFAQPEIKEIASMMRDLYWNNEPMRLEAGAWHLPMWRDDDPTEALFDNVNLTLNTSVPSCTLICTGRCARVSYLTHDGKRDLQADIDLALEKLAPSGHWSPFEHVAQVQDDDAWYGNFCGFKQLRKFFLNESGSKRTIGNVSTEVLIDTLLERNAIEIYYINPNQQIKAVTLEGDDTFSLYEESMIQVRDKNRLLLLSHNG